jgi:outer membrane protein OmpA-like peptidoglycan-associated protein
MIKNLLKLFFEKNLFFLFLNKILAMRSLTIPLLFLILIRMNGQIPEKSYAKFDFIPGEKVLFDDNFQNERPDEIPSYWEVTGGRVETSIINGEKVLGFLDQNGAANLRLKKNTTLGNRLTFEFEYLWRNNKSSWIDAYNEGVFSGERIYINFGSPDDRYNLSEELGDLYEGIYISHTGVIDFGNFSGKYNMGKLMPETSEIYEDLCDKWVRVSISVTENSLRVYLNAQRVLNAPIKSGKLRNFHIEGDGVSIEENGSQLFVRQVRLAEGGIDPYKTLSIDGKIIARGINFESGKSTLKPESLGALNNIVQMMNTHPELKFEVSGHTDSDGNDASNLNLSTERAIVVKNKLISLGISGERLTTKGYGETKPISDNTTSEGKANNRRVEFLKINS